MIWEKDIVLGRKETEDRMREFNYSKLADRTWDNEIISYISKIHEYKGSNLGIQFFYNRMEEL